VERGGWDDDERKREQQTKCEHEGGEKVVSLVIVYRCTHPMRLSFVLCVSCHPRVKNKEKSEHAQPKNSLCFPATPPQPHPLERERKRGSKTII
jgi:hypothetical protein